MLDHDLYVKAEKCEVHQKLSFLGYHISLEGFRMEDCKVSMVTEWPEPTTVKVLQRFLGFANFYLRFIQGFSAVVALLTDLQKGKRLKHVIHLGCSASIC